jgi:hypothetical protein
MIIIAQRAVNSPSCTAEGAVHRLVLHVTTHHASNQDENSASSHADLPHNRDWRMPRSR